MRHRWPAQALPAFALLAALPTRALAHVEGASAGAGFLTGFLHPLGGPDHVLALETFGLQLGIAFQLLDDIQDYLSDQTYTGKEPGRDLAEGKVTLPVLVAFRQAGTKDKKRIRHIISAPQREKHLRELTTLLEDHGGFAYTLRAAEERIRMAVSALHLLPASEERVDVEQAARKMLRDNTPRR